MLCCLLFAKCVAPTTPLNARVQATPFCPKKAPKSRSKSKSMRLAAPPLPSRIKTDIGIRMTQGQAPVRVVPGMFGAQAQLAGVGAVRVGFPNLTKYDTEARTNGSCERWSRLRARDCCRSLSSETVCRFGRPFQPSEKISPIRGERRGRENKQFRSTPQSANNRAGE